MASFSHLALRGAGWKLRSAEPRDWGISGGFPAQRPQAVGFLLWQFRVPGAGVRVNKQEATWPLGQLQCLIASLVSSSVEL